MKNACIRVVITGKLLRYSFKLHLSNTNLTSECMQSIVTLSLTFNETHFKQSKLDIKHLSKCYKSFIDVIASCYFLTKTKL